MLAARQTLDALTEGAHLEEATGFDPSGSGGGAYAPGCDGVNAHSESGHSVAGYGSTTDNTSISQGISSLDLEGGDWSDVQNIWEEETAASKARHGHNYNAQLENMDVASKEAMLIETFPCLTPFDIKWTLRKCKGNTAQAIEELLNQVFLEESGSRRRGIEGFSEDSHHIAGRRSKGKKKRLKHATDMDAALGLDSPSPEMLSMWENAKKDVDFLSSHTGFPTSQVTSIYYDNGASLKASILAIVEAHLSLQLDTQDATTQRQAQDLLRQVPSLSLEHSIALIQLTDFSTTDARALATALTARSPSQSTSTPIKIEICLPPPDLSDHSPPSTPDSRLPPSTTTALPLTSAAYTALRTTALAQASSAHRKSKSSPLMSAAAAHYAQTAKVHGAHAHAATAAAADALVAAQSSATKLDLHGVNVANAQRIVRTRVAAWWAKLAGPRGEVVGLHDGFTIVTGRGVHSPNGASRLGPAVVRTLVAEGWRVEVGVGVVRVVGVLSRAKGKRR